MDNIASIKRRLIAFGLDDMIISLFLFIIFYHQIIAIKTPQQLLAFFELNTLYIIALKVIYHWVLVWQSGATIGDYIAKVKIVDEQNFENLSGFMALNRSIIRVGSEMFFYIGFLFAFFGIKKQTLHDKLSGAIAINA